jgi:hypothetical protein
MVVNAVADEFQQPDDTDYWWADLPEPKHFMMIPNAEHSLITGIFQAVPAIGAWIQNLLLEEQIPTFDWTISQETGEIVATLDNNNKVYSAHVWWAYSCGINNFDGVFRRDFRIAHLDNPCTCGLLVDGFCGALRSVYWSKQELNYTMVGGKRTYSAQFDAPGDGRWVAFLLDFKFINKHAFPTSAAEKQVTLKENPEQSWGGFPHDFGRFFEFTTQVSVWPNTFPYADCTGEDCGERIV